MFSSESHALERELSAAPSTTTHFDLETEQNVAFILSRGLKRAALQFPDTLLHHASTAASELELALSRTSEPVQVFVLGDTTFDGYQVDFVSAQHLAADCVIHYGPVDLDASGPLPVRLVLFPAGSSARINSLGPGVVVRASRPVVGAFVGAPFVASLVPTPVMLGTDHYPIPIRVQPNTENRVPTENI